MPSIERFSDNSPEVDKLLDTLSNALRRGIIDYFENVVDQVTANLDDIIQYINSRISDSSHQELATLFMHKHLPKLQARDWLDYDSRTKDIQYYGHDNAADLLDDLQAVFTA